MRAACALLMAAVALTACRSRWGAGPPGGTYGLDISCRKEGGVSEGGTQSMDWDIATTSTEARLFSTPFFTLVTGMTCSWSVSASSSGMQVVRSAVSSRTAITR